MDEEAPITTTPLQSGLANDEARGVSAGAVKAELRL